MHDGGLMRLLCYDYEAVVKYSISYVHFKFLFHYYYEEVTYIMCGILQD